MRTGRTAGAALAAAALLAASIVGMGATAEPARAVVPSQAEYQRKVASHASLKQQLAGVSSDLARQIEQLNDLTENQIPAAQQAADAAQQAAQQARDLAEATGERLDAARKDKSDLEERIKQTGEDYDDAKDAVAQMARESFHTSDTSQMMQVITDSGSTKDFVDKMQADAAVTRSESNAANAAAVTLSTSMNRKQRLQAIEDEIAALKAKADEQSRQAQQAAADAKAKQEKLAALREQGDKRRAELEAQQSSLKTKEAREAAQIVTMKSQIDSYNQQLAAQQQRPTVHTGPQGSTGGGTASAPVHTGGGAPSSGGGGAQGMNYAVPGNCAPLSSSCYGHPTGDVGLAYAWSQCTWWAYLRRHQLYLPVGSYLGNGQDWGWKARQLGYLVNNIPHYGAAISIKAGMLGSSPLYGHVAIVERVNGDGTILISESGSRNHGRVTYRTISNPGLYTYVHY